MKPPVEVEREGIVWIAVGSAARRCGVLMAELRRMAEAGEVLSWDDGGTLRIARSAVMRLKRENAAMRAVKKLNAAPMGAPGRVGPHSAHREHQPVLPMTSGRGGRGWMGQTPRR